jgi:hypothetical protein
MVEEKLGIIITKVLEAFVLKYADVEAAEAYQRGYSDGYEGAM